MIFYTFFKWIAPTVRPTLVVLPSSLSIQPWPLKLGLNQPTDIFDHSTES